jgi:hypothetical protein
MRGPLGKGISLAFVLVALWAAPAGADVTGQTINAVAAPSAQSASLRAGVGLEVDLDTSFTIPTPAAETISEAVVHLDDDFAVEATGIPQCNPASLVGTTTSEAKIACPGSQLGSGGATLCSALGGCPTSSITGVVTAFNGTPSGGNPTLVLHLRLDPPVVDTTIVMVGAYGASSRGGDFGTQVALTVPDTAATGHHFRHLDFTLGLTTATGGNYLSARCADPERLWDYAVDATFRSGAGTFSDTSSQGCSVASPPPAGSGIPQSKTGKRAKALRKCKKKKQKRARQRCSKRAKKLPV